MDDPYQHVHSPKGSRSARLKPSEQPRRPKELGGKNRGHGVTPLNKWVRSPAGQVTSQNLPHATHILKSCREAWVSSCPRWLLCAESAWYMWHSNVQSQWTWGPPRLGSSFWKCDSGLSLSRAHGVHMSPTSISQDPANHSNPRTSLFGSCRSIERQLNFFRLHKGATIIMTMLLQNQQGKHNTLRTKARRASRSHATHSLPETRARQQCLSKQVTGATHIDPQRQSLSPAACGPSHGN